MISQTTTPKRWVGTIFRKGDDVGWGYHYALAIHDLDGAIWKMCPYFAGDAARDIVRQGYAMHTVEARSEVALKGMFRKWVEHKIRM